MSPQEILLGQLILNPRLYFEHDIRAHDFDNAQCRKVYETIGRILERGDHVDLATVSVELPKVDRSWLASLTNEFTPNVRRLVESVVDESRRARLTVLARETVDQLKDQPTAEVLERLEAGLTDLAEGRGEDVRLLKDSVLGKVEEFERRYKSKGEIPGIASGIVALDNVTLGWGESRLIVVGARPSEGKSALLLHCALHAASTGIATGIVSLESSRDEVLERAFCAVGGIDGYQLRAGTYGPSRMKDISDAAMQISNLPIYIADRPNMEITELKSRVRRMVRVHGCRLICIDYIQLVQVRGLTNDYERVSHASMAIKNLARELNVPIIAAAQLSRSGDEGKRARKPRLSDFKNSGQIEQDADTAILIYRKGDERDEQTWLCVEKNRDGAKKDVQVHFDKSRMRWSALAHDAA